MSDQEMQSVPKDDTEETSWELMKMLPDLIEDMGRLEKMHNKGVKENYYWIKSRVVLRKVSSWIDAMKTVVENEELPIARERDNYEKEIEKDKEDQKARTVQW